MTELILVSIYASLGSAAALIFLSHLAPRFGKGGLTAEMEPPELFGKKLKARESHFVGILVHFFYYGFWGVAYGLAVEFAGFDSGVTGFLMLSALVTFVSTCVVMPIEGFGLFGRKLDRWFFIDSLLTNIVWVMLFAFMLRLWLG